MGKLLRLELYSNPSTLDKTETALISFVDFKSYKGHHTLQFSDSYFTSIIGPNGSGKSNSMDAISFVLGIKSSHLRSSHLRDLIYRGRVLRTSKINVDGSATKPVEDDHPNGNAGLDEDDSQQGTQERHDPKSAWVMAVYKDDAEDEHQWKRTIIKQGEQVTSEYRINNRVVTASQYNEALEAENILIKARNFLVFQGDVEAIASQSPKDLTKLVEQISGSLEYKAEYERLKHAHEEALDNQTYTFNRRRGINSEVKQYQEQKREADNYAQKADEKDEAIVRHILWKLYHFQRVMDESGEQMRKHQEELKEFRRGVEKYEKGLEEAKKEQARVGRDVSKVEREIKRKEKEIDEKENSLVPIEEKFQISGKKIKTVNTRIEVLAKERDSHSQRVKQLSKDLKVVEKAQAQWEGESNKLAQQEGRELSEADLQQYNKLKEEVNKQTSANQIKVDHLTRQHKTDEETVNSLESKVKSTEWQVGEHEGNLKKIYERKQAMENRIQQTSKEIEQKKKELNNVTSERLRVAGVRTELDEKLQEVLSKLVEAENGKKQNEKELRMKEIVATLKRTYPGVKGRLSELCKPKQKKYAEAVSTVLGRHFDAVVVDNEKTAKDCIQHLRDQRSGQATFIPLDTIQVKAVNSNLKGMHRGMRLAIDTIEYDNAFERAVLYACGNAIVCDDLATAKYICYDRGVEAKAVTLDGTVIHKGGLMTGGRGPGQQNARRWEDAEVENLRKLKDNLLAEFEKLPKGHQKNVEEETLQGELTGLEQWLAHDKEEVKALERNIASKSKELDSARRLLNETQPKYAEKAGELQTVKENLEGFQHAVAEVEDDIFAEFCQRLGYKNIRTYEAQQGSLQREGAQKRLEFQKQKSTIESQIRLEQDQLQDKKERIIVLETQATQHQSLITELEAQKESIQDKLDNLNAELDQLKEQLVQQKAKYAKRAEKVAEQRHEVQKRTKNVEGTVKAVNGLEAEIQRNAADKYALLRRCKLEDIKIPLEEDSADLDQLPIDDLLQADPDTMDIDEDPDSSNIRLPVVQDYGIEVDFDTLDDDLKENSDEKLEDELQEKINTLNAELDKMAPNMHAIERLPEVQGRLETTNREFEEARKRAKQAKEDFQKVRQQRYGLFEKAFSYISDRIDQVYKELTRSTNMPVGGQAYLDLENDEEPYLEGIKYHAMPPAKRFRDMEHLSGGEKTMAALALLFAVHGYQPSPFFVLDEVDAALDNANVAKIANYIREHAQPGMQFIVISLKTSLFQESEALVGIYRDQTANSSKALTLDLRKYQ